MKAYQSQTSTEFSKEEIVGELKIWLTAAQLEESHGNVERAEMVTARAVDAMHKAGVERDRDSWLQEAVMSEIEAGLPRVAVALIRATKGEGGLEVASGKSTISSKQAARVDQGSWRMRGHGRC